MLASTRSPASLSSSSFGPYNGDLGNAIKPVLVDSRIPKGAMSFTKESIRVGFADLKGWLASKSSTYDCSTGLTYISTMQLFVEMSRTFPPN